MGSIKLPHASGNSMSIAAPATNPASDLELKLPATIGTAGQALVNSSTAGTLEFVNNAKTTKHYDSDAVSASSIEITSGFSNPIEIKISYYLMTWSGDPSLPSIQIGTSSGYHSSNYNEISTNTTPSSTSVTACERTHDGSYWPMVSHSNTNNKNIYSGSFVITRCGNGGKYSFVKNNIIERTENNNQYNNYGSGRVDIGGELTRLKIYAPQGTTITSGGFTITSISEPS